MDFVMQLVTLSVLAGGCAGWGVAFRRLARKQPVLTHDLRRPAPWGLIDLALTAGLLMTFQHVNVFLLRQGCGIDPTRGWEHLSSPQLALVTFSEPVANLAALATAWMVIALRVRAGWLDLGISLRHLRQDVWLGLAAFAMLAPPVYALQRLLVVWFPYRHPLISMLRQHPEPLVQTAVFFSAVVAAPIVEEFFYRVLWQGWLQAVLPRRRPFQQLVLGRPAVDGPSPGAGSSPAGENGATATAPPTLAAETLAIIVCSTLFAAMHVSHGPAPIPLFVLGLGLGYLYARTGRVLPCIVVHVLLNGCSLAMLLLDLHAR